MNKQITKMSGSDCDCDVIEKTAGERLYSYLERNPTEYDVTFSVGPQKEEVKALRIILKASSTVFESEFNDKWENSVEKNGDSGIPLPDLDAKMFRIFVKLLISDTWSKETLQALMLPADEFFKLIFICRKFRFVVAVKHLEELAPIYFKDFKTYVETDAFIKLSKSNLETVISSNHIPSKETDVLEAVCRWAEFRCREKQREPSNSNLRHELDSVLNQIRFPLMSLDDLKSPRIKSILTAEERVTIYDFITLSKEDRLNFDTVHFPYNTQPRRPLTFSVIDLVHDCQVVESPPFECDGKAIFSHGIKISQRIAVQGFGFLGPIDSDAFFEVTVEIRKIINKKIVYQSEPATKTIFAQKGKLFHFYFDEPIHLDPITAEGWDDRHAICFYLKGPNTKATDSTKKFSIRVEDVEFHLWRHGKQLVEILFEKL